MSDIYTRLAATAVRLLTKYGKPIRLTRKGSPVYNPATSTTTSTPESHTVIGAKFDYSQDDIDGTTIRSGDQRAYIAPNAPVTPKTGDTLTFADGAWNVVASRPLAPADLVVLHDVQLRK